MATTGTLKPWGVILTSCRKVCKPVQDAEGIGRRQLHMSRGDLQAIGLILAYLHDWIAGPGCLDGETRGLGLRSRP